MELLLGWLSLGFQSGKRTVPYSHIYAERTTGSHAGRTLPSEPGTPRDPGPPWEEEFQIPSTRPVPGTTLGTHVHCTPHSVLIGTLGNSRTHCHFTDEDTEADREADWPRLMSAASPKPGVSQAPHTLLSCSSPFMQPHDLLGPPRLATSWLVTPTLPEPVGRTPLP